MKNIRIGLGYKQQPFAVYQDGIWRIYTHYNPDVSSGTYFALYNNGLCDQITFVDNETINIDRVTTGAVV